MGVPVGEHSSGPAVTNGQDVKEMSRPTGTAFGDHAILERAYQTVLGPGYTAHSGLNTHVDHIDHRSAGLTTLQRPI